MYGVVLSAVVVNSVVVTAVVDWVVVGGGSCGAATITLKRGISENIYHM